MINIAQKEDCVGCNACVQRCTKQCISMNEDTQGFLYPHIDVSKCIECGLCEKVCPVINQNEPREPNAVYAAKNKDPEIVRTSSSGGIFHALAKQVIDEGGVVFGARFDVDWQIIHDWTDTIEGIKAFQGSKYVQSRIGNCYLQTEYFLKSERKVLFSGTPCQIAGLKRFLRKDYGDRLLTVDVICHGVPSPLVWREYLKFISLPKGATAGKNTVLSSLNVKPAIAGISFRDKRLGWEKFGFAVRYATTEGSGKNSVLQSAISEKGNNANGFFEPHRENLFMKCFLNDVCLRPSCYKCPAKCGKSHSDLTLGDFWGIRNTELINRICDYQKGVSCVLVNSENGKSLMQATNIVELYSSINVVLCHNPSIRESVSKPNNRDKFFRYFQKSGDVIESLKKYGNKPLKVRLRSKVIKVLIQIKLLKALQSIKK